MQMESLQQVAAIEVGSTRKLPLTRRVSSCGIDSQPLLLPHSLPPSFAYCVSPLPHARTNIPSINTNEHSLFLCDFSSNGSTMTLSLRISSTTDYPICIHCSRPARAIYKHYTANLVVLLPCSGTSCGGFIDSYAEEEYRDSGSSRVTTSWVDLILVKPRAYRHFLYNTRFLLPKSQSPHGKLEKGHQYNLSDHKEEQEHPNRRAWLTVAKRFTALSLVDAYLRWFYLCAYGQSSFTNPSTRAYESLPQYSLPRLLVAGLDVIFWRRRTGRPNATYAMGASYFLVWASTFAETLALYGTVSLFSTLYVASVRLLRQFRRIEMGEDITLPSEGSAHSTSTEDEDSDGAVEDASAFLLSPSKESQEELHAGITGPAAEPLEGVDMIDLYRAHLVPTALLLSSLSTLILLCIVLLWESKLPRPSSVAPVLSAPPRSGLSSSHLLPIWLSQSAPVSLMIDEMMSLVGSTFSTDFAVRTLLGGLSAGVSLAVIHPRSPLLTTSLLLLGWLAASLVRSHFTLLPSPDVGPGTSAVQAGIGQGFVWQDVRGARSVYCAAPA
ncbi:hypothetical protein BCV69DRAFT_180849 [Microstroma glucosiphilum]|uniref:Protein ARV n=1 Tax=Pseudomicrostroma glucosiphilum TaxID=1684307 RepID=A0A316U819_9BASI|nr:hypothetical protein BCV69DRAFT_180849 [Pseudomicrostroma glucosiphilum]PWN20994.1 hypothetical protein BCV69DRAFT_180849 [Pseudomicrostroma glucosiphilum]